ncbi:MAG TPA: hypothetical protein DDZ79_09060 [Aequorivita sp.]|nr:hypothetical protein [Aequorivita sp.]
MKKSSTYIPAQKAFIALAVMLCTCAGVSGQFYNKEYEAKIYVKKESEFFTFAATAENLTPTDINLKYDFSIYSADKSNNVTRSNQTDLFFLKANEKKVLSTVAVNYSIEDKITIVLVLYDKDDKPVGQDRIELIYENGYQKLVNEEALTPQAAVSQDQAAPQDGYIMDGLVVENTLTKAGRDFYKYFYSEYYNRGIQTKKNIVIEEVPGRMRSTRISVKIDDRVVWQFFSQPKKSFLQSMAITALDRCIAHLQQLQQQKDNTLTRY